MRKTGNSLSRRMCWLAVLLIPLAASLVWLASLDWERKVSTNVMDLIPNQAPAPELAVARSLLSEVYADRISVALYDVSDPLALKTYKQQLAASPLIASVVDLAADTSMQGLGQMVFEYRFPLLFPQWLATAQPAVAETAADVSTSALADYAVTRLDAALEDPAISAFEEMIPEDPLLLVPNAAQAFLGLGRAGQNLPPDTYLLEVKLAVSALSYEGQEPVFELFEQALAAARAYAPQMLAIDSGAHRFAAATEANMRSEVNWLNLSTFLAVLTICILLCRRVLLVLHVFAMLLISLVLSVAVMTLCFERINVFALVFGCVLCGVIVDYGLHAYLHGAGTGERRLKDFLRPFLISCGSTLAGFMILLFSELPVLQQMGAFVSCGLGVATVVTLVYTFGVLSRDPVSPVMPFSRGRRFSTLWMMPVLGLLSLLLLPSITWQDDIRSLKYPLPTLEAQEAQVKELRGADKEILITVGDSYAQVMQHFQELQAWLVASGVAADAWLSPGRWIPTQEEYLATGSYAQAHPEFGQRVLLALAAAGYDADAFEPFQQAWQGFVAQTPLDAERYERLIASLAASMSGTLTGVLGTREGLYWCVTLIDAGATGTQSLPVAAHSLRLNQIESLSRVLSSYRHRTFSLSLWASALICLILLAVFGPRVGTTIMSVPAAAVSVATSGMFWMTGSLGMFHLVGMFLGVCLVLDYAVFSWIGFRRDGVVPFSVFVSGMTTSASFLILSLSKIPSIHALGLSVFMVTLIGLSFNYSFIPRIAERMKSDG